MTSPFPHVPDMAAYSARYEDDAYWRPGVEAICAAAGLDPSRLTRALYGTNLVYLVAPDAVLKISPPLWPDEADVEARVLAFFGGRIGDVRTPTLRAHGVLHGWTYQLIDRLPGEPIKARWDGLEPGQQRGLMRQLGATVARIHALDPAPLRPHLDAPWPDTLDRLCANVNAKLAHPDVHPAWGPLLGPWFERQRALVPDTPNPPVLVTADLTYDHLLIEPDAGGDGWRLTGLIDFADAFIGHAPYEFSAPASLLMRGRGDLLHAFLGAYGLPVHARGAAMQRALTFWALAHRYSRARHLGDALAAPPEGDDPVERLCATLWPLERSGATP